MGRHVANGIVWFLRNPTYLLARRQVGTSDSTQILDPASSPNGASAGGHNYNKRLLRCPARGG
jgi:hypothetical protein